ncbi:MAG: hypothetical protein ACD_37C00679G0003 [uncultured bacterium]|nr:MAG: hypothetical protein ACD_37C00679G0003 [uncultured bacterium]
MRNNFLVEILIAMGLIMLLILLLDPFMALMTTPIQTMMIAGILIFFVSFCAFVWRENTKDEREQFHKHIASRLAYLCGSAILIVGVIFQSLNHALDPWLVIALIVIILAKITGAIYAEKKY